jgi:limonene-1,2-epoxide hydrolase
MSSPDVAASPAAAFSTAFQAHDLDGMVAALAPDVVIRSPVTGRLPFKGHDECRELLGLVRDLFDEVTYTDELAADGVATLVMRIDHGGEEIHEVLLMRFDDAGLIREMTVFMRPLPALAGFAAAIAPALARRRRGRLRAAAVASFTRPIAALLRIGDRAGSRMV